jgi:hypothetical protein
MTENFIRHLLYKKDHGKEKERNYPNEVKPTNSHQEGQPSIPIEPISKFGKIFRFTESLIRNPQRLDILLRNLAGAEYKLNGAMYLQKVCHLSESQFVENRLRQQKELIIDVEKLCRDLSGKITERQPQANFIMRGRMEILRHSLVAVATTFALEVSNFIRSAKMYEMSKELPENPKNNVGDVIISSYISFYRIAYKILQPLYYSKYEKLDPEFMENLKSIVVEHAKNDVIELTSHRV